MATAEALSSSSSSSSTELWIQRVQETLGTIVTKPRLTERYLRKPPFRFLHDVILETNRVTGIAKGLYDSKESDCSFVNDKEKKIAFLEKIIACVGFLVKEQIDVSPNKIVAGLEPEKTSDFLIKLHEASTQHIQQAAEAVKKVLNGETPQRRDSSTSFSSSSSLSSLTLNTSSSCPATKQPPKSPKAETAAKVSVARKDKKHRIADAIQTSSSSFSPSSSADASAVAQSQRDAATVHKALRSRGVSNQQLKFSRSSSSSKLPSSSSAILKTSAKLLQKNCSVSSVPSSSVFSSISTPQEVSPEASAVSQKSKSHLSSNLEKSQIDPLRDSPSRKTAVARSPAAPVSSSVFREDSATSQIDSFSPPALHEKKTTLSPLAADRREESFESSGAHESMEMENSANSGKIQNIDDGDAAKSNSYMMRRTYAISSSSVSAESHVNVNQEGHKKNLEHTSESSSKSLNKEDEEEQAAMSSSAKSFERHLKKTSTRVEDVSNVKRLPFSDKDYYDNNNNNMEVSPTSSKPSSPGVSIDNAVFLSEDLKLSSSSNSAFSLPPPSSDANNRTPNPTTTATMKTTIIPCSISSKTTFPNALARDVGSTEEHGKLVRDLLEVKKQMQQQHLQDGEEGKTKTTAAAASGVDEKTTSVSEDTAEGIVIMGKLRRPKASRHVQLQGPQGVEETRKLLQVLCQAINPLGKSMEFVHSDLAKMGDEMDIWRQRHREATAELQKEKQESESLFSKEEAKIRQLNQQIHQEKLDLTAIQARLLRNDEELQSLLQAL